MARPSTAPRLARILAMVPWIAARESPTIDEVCEQFGLDRAQLLDDLEVIPMVGLYPYTPDNLIEIFVDGDRVHLTYGNFFEAPLRLSPAEGLMVLAAGAASAAQPGHDPEGPLARGVAKLGRVLGVEPGDDLAVVLAGQDSPAFETLRAAVDERRVVHIEYFSHARGVATERDIEPVALSHHGGAWYVTAFCRSSAEDRVFRVDRVLAARSIDERFEHRDRTPLPIGVDFDDSVPRVALELAPGGRWVVDEYAVDEVDELGDGWVRCDIPITGPAFLERLLLRLGPDGRVIEAPDDLRGVGVAAARRLLERYLPGA